MTRIIVFTDLDGTLLDHDTYSYADANDALALLHAHNIPLILASSKTAAEIRPLRAELGFSQCPAIVENGSGVISGETTDESAREQANDYGALLDVLNATPAALRKQFESFSDWSPEEIAKITGLPLESAKLAGMRQFSEPGLWRGDDAGLSEFITHLSGKGVAARRGGRFLTLSFGTTKGQRVREVAALYTAESIAPKTIALGDAPNDIEMIEAVDFGVIIANPHGKDMPQLDGETSGNIERSVLNGPKGWNESVIRIVSSLL